MLMPGLSVTAIGVVVALVVMGRARRPGVTLVSGGSAPGSASSSARSPDCSSTW